MSQTPAKTNTLAVAPGAPRKISQERTIVPDVAITNLKLKFEEIRVQKFSLDAALQIDEETERRCIDQIMNAPLDAFSYEGLAEAMENPSE